MNYDPHLIFCKAGILNVDDSPNKKKHDLEVILIVCDGKESKLLIFSDK